LSGTSKPPNDQLAFLAGIGHVCLQWALIEQTLLGIISAAEHMPLEKTYTRYGSTGMIPRLTLAINLAQEAKWASPLVKRLREVRKTIQKGLDERRNLFVHGAHKGEIAPGQFELTMARWSPNNRSQIVTVEDVAELVSRLSELAQELERIYRDYGTWKFGPGANEDSRQHVPETKPIARLIRARQIKRAIRLLLANLKPW
jgi:hypothetical protein